jgi:hypothetical protein
MENTDNEHLFRDLDMSFINFDEVCSLLTSSLIEIHFVIRIVGSI